VFGPRLLTACADETGADTPPGAISSTAAGSPATGEASAEPAEAALNVAVDAATGTVVPAGEVEQARAAGIPVYVPSTGGDGVVVRRGDPLPELLVNDQRSLIPASYEIGAPLPAGTAQGNNQATEAFMGLSTRVAAIRTLGLIDNGVIASTSYSIGVTGGDIDETRAINKEIAGSYPSKEAALAALQPTVDQYGLAILDLT